uniref:Uncharacterized protein n=1 Tax=Zooxanthella nutricula TaxID=1333877 RepID=A0A7S2QMI5_9DINO
MPLSASGAPSALGAIISVGGVEFVRVDHPGRVAAYTQPGAKLMLMHDFPGHGGYFMVPDGNLLCGLIQWVVQSDGVVAPHYWMERSEHRGLGLGGLEGGVLVAPQ